MNRRGFLKSLLGAATGAALAPTLGRVYSFPTSIRLANLAEINQYCDYLSVQQDIGNGFLETEVPKSVTYLFGKNALFVANLNKDDRAQYTEADTIITAYRDSTCGISFWEGPSIADPEYLCASTEWDELNNIVSRASRINPPRRTCQLPISPQIST